MLHSYRLLIPFVLLAVPFFFLGCVTTGQESGAGGNPSKISQDEIQEAGNISNTYNLVRRLRPQWLRKRGRSSVQQPGDIIVYVDGAEQGGPEALRQIDVIDLKSVEFLDPGKATMRYGGGHDNGAIRVQLKDGDY